MMAARLRQAGMLWPTVATLLALSILLGLGSWQLQRKTWKEGLIARIQSRAGATPVPLERLPAGGGDLEYTRVSARGRFLHERELHFFAPERSGPGYHILTPLELTDGRIVFVNRGWVPEALRRPEQRAAGQIAGTVEVVGLVRATGPRTAFMPANDAAHNIWYWRDLPAMAAAALGGQQRQVLAMTLDADARPPNPGGWPRGGITRLELSNKHLEYALTWYGLAAALLGVFVAFARGRLRRSDIAA